MEELLERIIEFVISFVVPVLELMGIFIVAEAAIVSFGKYLYCLVTRNRIHVKGRLAVGLLLGAVGLLRLETLAGRLLNAGPGRSGRMVLAVTLHNLPEGMVVGLAAALALRGEPDAISGALALALGIGLQNIPEGAAVSLPLAQEGRSKCRAFAAGAASGLVEPLGGLLALALAGWVSAALPWLMSLAAGCMVCVTAQEMIPEAVEADEPAGVISVVAGFALMMALDVAL